MQMILQYVEMLLGQIPPSQEFLFAFKQWSLLSSHELMKEADEGIQNRHGEIEYKHPHQDRIMMYLILACRMSNGESVEALHQAIRGGIIWELNYDNTPLLKILFCVYHFPIIKEAILHNAQSKSRVIRARIEAIAYTLRAIKHIAYCPENLLIDLRNVLSEIREDLKNDEDLDEEEKKWRNEDIEDTAQDLSELLLETKPKPPILPLIPISNQNA